MLKKVPISLSQQVVKLQLNLLVTMPLVPCFQLATNAQGPQASCLHRGPKQARPSLNPFSLSDSEIKASDRVPTMWPHSNISTVTTDVPILETGDSGPPDGK